MSFNTSVQISPHARERMQQRGISVREVDTVLYLGQREREADEIKVCLEESKLSKDAPGSLMNLLGIVVVLSTDGHLVVTAYRIGEPPLSPELRRRFSTPGLHFPLGEIIKQKLGKALNSLDDPNC